MTDITPPEFSNLEAIHPVFLNALYRAIQGYVTLGDGNVTASGTPDMKTNLASGWKGNIAGVYAEVSATDVTHDAQDATNDRFDLVYMTAAGAYAIHKGTAAAKSVTDAGDPNNWHKYISPYPADSFPEGVPLALVHIKSTANGGGTVTSSDIWEIGPLWNMSNPKIIGPYVYDHADSSPATICAIPSRSWVDAYFVEPTEDDAGGFDAEFGISGNTDCICTDTQRPKSATNNDLHKIIPEDEDAMFFPSGGILIMTVNTAGTGGAGRIWLKITTLPTS